jgi:hypothetical protein
MKHSPGNNFKCDKIFKLEIPLINANLVNQVAGTYFLPEVPELTGKTIVGIIGENVNTLLYNDIQGTICFGAAYLSIYNMNNETIFEDFPLPSLYNNDNTTIATGSRKIPPINTKINLRQSYIKFAQGQNFAPGKPRAFSLTFFYNYK